MQRVRPPQTTTSMTFTARNWRRPSRRSQTVRRQEPPSLAGDLHLILTLIHQLPLYHSNFRTPCHAFKMTLSIPDDIIELIIQVMPKSEASPGALNDLLSLCLTSRQLVNVCQKYIFASIDIPYNAQPSKAESVIAGNPRLGLYVRRLDWTLAEDPGFGMREEILEAANAVRVKVARTMTNVTEVAISYNRRPRCSRLFTFPGFDTMSEWQKAVFTTVVQSPQLRCLSISNIQGFPLASALMYNTSLDLLDLTGNISFLWSMETIFHSERKREPL